LGDVEEFGTVYHVVIWWGRGVRRGWDLTEVDWIGLFGESFGDVIIELRLKLNVRVYR
jgi:hypothetical protein